MTKKKKTKTSAAAKKAGKNKSARSSESRVFDKTFKETAEK